jgi:hypothetical protein
MEVKKMSGKRLRIGGEYLNDPNTIEARDTYFVSFEKGLAGNDGRTPETPISMAGALTVSKSLSSTVKGLYGTKVYALPTTESQSAGAGYDLNKEGMSIEGVTCDSPLSNPSLTTSTDGGYILNISQNNVSVKGLSMNNKEFHTSLIKFTGTLHKPTISKCKFFNYGTGDSSSAAPYTDVRGINMTDENGSIHYAQILDNVFFRFSKFAIGDDDGTNNVVNSVISGNKIFGAGYAGQSIYAGIYFEGDVNVEVSNNIVNAGYIGSSAQGTIGILLTSLSSISAKNCVAGFTTAITATLSRGDSTS